MERSNKIHIAIFVADAPEEHQDPLLRSLAGNNNNNNIQNLNLPSEKQDYFLTKPLQPANTGDVKGLKSPRNKLNNEKIRGLSAPGTTLGPAEVIDNELLGRSKLVLIVKLKMRH